MERKYIPDSEIERAVQCAVRSISRCKDVGSISENDLFQEGMVYALEHIGEYRAEQASVMTFLFRPLKTHLNRLLQREIQSSGMMLPESDDDDEEAQEMHVGMQDTAQVFSYETDLGMKLDVKAILDTLTEEERDIVTERFMNGVRLKDVATRCGITESAMHHRISAIIDKLRHRFGVGYETSRD